MRLSVKSKAVEAISVLRSHLRGDAYWEKRLSTIEEDLRGGNFSVHVAVFVEPYLSFLLDGTKTVESRFSVNRCAPYKYAKEGDVILIKQSGGGIVAICEISAKWYYELNEAAWGVIKHRFAGQLAIKDPSFWEAKKQACYASLFKVKNVAGFDPVNFEKRDRRGWIVLGGERQEELF